MFTKKYTTEAATHGRMSDSVNAAEVDWLCNQSGLPPSTAYARPAAERASTFCPALKSALYHVRLEKITLAIEKAMAAIQTAGR